MSNNAAALARIESLAQQGLVEQAELACKELLNRAPHEDKVWAWLGVLALQGGRTADAENAFRKATALDRHNAGYWSNLSIAVHSQGRFEEAEGYARRCLKLDDSVSAHWNNLAGCLNDQRRSSEALEAAEQALMRDPHNASALSNLGAAEFGLGQMTEAQQALERSLALAPGRPTTLTRYGTFLAEVGRQQEATRILEDVLARNPGMASARYALAYIKVQHWLLPDAEIVLRLLLTSEPNHADAWSLLGMALLKQGLAAEAVAAMQRALEIAPNSHRHSGLLGNLSYVEGMLPERLLSEHRRWASVYAEPLLPPAPAAVGARPAQAGLRIGLVSADFYMHPVAYLLLPFLKCLDKSRCTIACYSDRLMDDTNTAQFQAVADIWRKTVSLTDEALSEQIRRDEIDVLIDLMGHTGKRMLVFARKPAAVQLTWLGYVGTTGLSAVDWLVADRFHVQLGEEAAYAESVLRMPNGYACYAPPLEFPEVGGLPALAAGHVTFGSFNNPAKLSPGGIDVWAQILTRVPTAMLLLKYGGLDQPGVRESIQAQFAQRGVNPARLIFEGWSPIHEFVAAYHRVDIALDTQPYSGGVTTCEAMWMGVPVITCPGPLFASRHATSHLSNAGFGQFIAADKAGYVDLAVEWANRLDELSRIRATMREQVSKSPLCDAPRFARDFLALVTEAWKARTICN